MRTITFNKSSKKAVLNLLKKTTDNEGFIVEESNKNQRVITPEGENVGLKEFAGVRKGSQVFIKSDFPSLIALTDYINR